MRYLPAVVAVSLTFNVLLGVAYWLEQPATPKLAERASKAVSYVQPSVFDMLAGASPASAMDGWAE